MLPKLIQNKNHEIVLWKNGIEAKMADKNHSR